MSNHPCFSLLQIDEMPLSEFRKKKLLYVFNTFFGERIPLIYYSYQPFQPCTIHFYKVYSYLFLIVSIFRRFSVQRRRLNREIFLQVQSFYTFQSYNEQHFEEQKIEPPNIPSTKKQQKRERKKGSSNEFLPSSETLQQSSIIPKTTNNYPEKISRPATDSRQRDIIYGSRIPKLSSRIGHYFPSLSLPVAW